MATQHTPPPLAELKLSPALKQTINTALERGRIRKVYENSPAIERDRTAKAWP
jgi:hypothetical protein